MKMSQTPRSVVVKRVIFFAVIAALVITLIVMTSLYATKKCAACPVCPVGNQCSCTSEPGARYAGGGFGAGSAADNVGPEGTANILNAGACANLCKVSAGCKQWVYNSDGKICYMHNTTYPTVKTTGGSIFTSGYCNGCPSS